MDLSENSGDNSLKRERNFPALDLKDQATLSTDCHPVLVVQSPKTPTLSRKLKAVSLDSDPQPQNTLDICRDVMSMPNTPKRQIKQKLSCDFDDGPPKSTLAPNLNSNLKKFASNNSISGSQTLKTLPEINALQDFSDCPVPEPTRVRTKGLLERRGSNASLTIDLGSTSSIPDVKPVPLSRLNTAKSVSNLYLSSMGSVEKCMCLKKCEAKVSTDRRKSQEACNNCIIYESVPSKINSCKVRCQNLKRCSCYAKCRRKSLSNENLYVPPCGICDMGPESNECDLRHCKANNRKALYPRQPDIEASELLSEDFKRHIQNIQYLQTASNVLSIVELQQSCEVTRVPKLHQEFWEVPLNLQEKCYVSGSQGKNRYRGVLPNEHSRVHLPGHQNYIHANYIKGPDYTETAYIATQGPLSHTCTDFWEMVWHSQCKCIVMLTGLVEKGRSKCELYFPLGKNPDTKEKSFFYVKTPKVRDKFTFDSKNVTEYDEETFEFEELNEVTFGKYHIRYVKQHDLDECQVRQLELKKLDVNVEPRVLYHYWLSNWPDHKKAHPEQVLKMAVDVLKMIEGIKGDSDSLDRSTKSDKKDDDREQKECSSESKARTLSFDLNINASPDVDRERCSIKVRGIVPSRFSFDDLDIEASMGDLQSQSDVDSHELTLKDSSCKSQNDRETFNMSETKEIFSFDSKVEDSSSTLNSTFKISKNNETLQKRFSFDSKLEDSNGELHKCDGKSKNDRKVSIGALNVLKSKEAVQEWFSFDSKLEDSYGELHKCDGKSKNDRKVSIGALNVLKSKEAVQEWFSFDSKLEDSYGELHKRDGKSQNDRKVSIGALNVSKSKEAVQEWFSFDSKFEDSSRELLNKSDMKNQNDGEASVEAEKWFNFESKLEDSNRESCTSDFDHKNDRKASVDRKISKNKTSAENRFRFESKLEDSCVKSCISDLNSSRVRETSIDALEMLTSKQTVEKWFSFESKLEDSSRESCKSDIEASISLNISKKKESGEKGLSEESCKSDRGLKILKNKESVEQGFDFESKLEDSSRESCKSDRGLKISKNKESVGKGFGFESKLEDSSRESCKSDRGLKILKNKESVEKGFSIESKFEDSPSKSELKSENTRDAARHPLTSSRTKETLRNRLSLDSTIHNLPEPNSREPTVTDLKAQTKREPLRMMINSQERKKSIENVRMPIIVHCSAGIGRTGCFLAVLNGIQQIRVNSNVDVLAILCSLRLNRGGMVQTAEQYELIHRVLSLYSKNMSK